MAFVEAALRGEILTPCIKRSPAQTTATMMVITARIWRGGMPGGRFDDTYREYKARMRRWRAWYHEMPTGEADGITPLGAVRPLLSCSP